MGSKVILSFKIVSGDEEEEVEFKGSFSDYTEEEFVSVFRKRLKRIIDHGGQDNSAQEA